MTSRAGSADVLDALGHPDRPRRGVGRARRCASIGFAFLFAPNFHPAMKHAGPTRREIGVRTAFNLLGPLTNPAGTRRQLLGVGDAALAARMAEVVQRLGTERTFVIHGDGVDELPLDGSGVAYIVAGDTIERHPIDAAALGFKRAATARLAGGTPEENARMTEAVLRGEPGSRRDVVLLNAGAALLVAGVVEPDGGGDRAGRADHRCRPRDRAARTAARRAASGRGGRAPQAAAGTGMTVAVRQARPSRDVRLAATRSNVVEEIAARRRADVLAELGRPRPSGAHPTTAVGRHPPRDRSSSGWPRPGCT